MQLDNLPVFELDVELEEGQANDTSSQEKTTPELIDEGDTEQTVSTDAVDYGENADPLAIETYNQLKDKGIIIDDPENPFDGTWDKLENSLESLPQRVLSTVIEQSPELAKQVVRFAFSSENITKEDLKDFMKTYLDEIEESSTSIESMDEARSYLESVYKERGMRPSAIRAALDALEEDDALIEEASLEQEKTSKTKHSKTDQIIAQKESEQLQKIEQQKTFVKQLSEELDQIGWSKTQVDKVKNTLSNNNLNKLLSDAVASPKALIKLADFLGYYDEKTKDINYSKFMTKADTKNAQAFRERVETAISTPNSNTKSTLTNPNKDLDDLIPVVN